MTHFQELLKPDSSDPGQQQERAARELPDVVKVSHLRWWIGPSGMPIGRKALLVVIAPSSQYDLALLDILDETVSSWMIPNGLPPVDVFVANIQRYETIEQLTKEIPLIKQAPLQTPVAAVWVGGRFRKFRQTACGKPGRDLVAATIGVPSEDLDRQVMARLPKYDPVE